MKRKPHFSSLHIFISVFILLAAFLAGAQNQPDRIHPALEQRLQKLAPGEKLAVIIELDTQAKPLEAISRMRGASRRAKVRAVVEALRSMADQHQGPLREHLQKQRAEGAAERIIPFWVFNGFAVTATEPMIRSLASRPDVREIRLDVKIPVPSLSAARKAAPSPVTEWNLE